MQVYDQEGILGRIVNHSVPRHDPGKFTVKITLELRKDEGSQTVKFEDTPRAKG